MMSFPNPSASRTSSPRSTNLSLSTVHIPSTPRPLPSLGSPKPRIPNDPISVLHGEHIRHRQMSRTIDSLILYPTLEEHGHDDASSRIWTGVNHMEDCLIERMTRRRRLISGGGAKIREMIQIRSFSEGKRTWKFQQSTCML